MDVQAIATALAARYDPGQVAPPAGLSNPSNVRQAIADLPEGVLALPSVVVHGPEEGSELGLSSQRRRFRLRFGVDFLFCGVPVMPRDEADLRRWFGVLISQTITGQQLGLSNVVDTTETVEGFIGVIEYAGIQYGGIALAVDVKGSEAVSPTV